ncbi:DUF3472 domain-containing protein [Candidatus Palauibacter sp.]|uniref:DUF3472 domain-containing protein n=1 Tax=Candidatus Palauibacter sp. TaxID=3101350 RepID=UPI003AF20A3F
MRQKAVPETTPETLSIVCFRANPAGGEMAEEALDELNREALAIAVNVSDKRHRDQGREGAMVHSRRMTLSHAAAPPRVDGHARARSGSAALGLGLALLAACDGGESITARPPEPQPNRAPVAGSAIEAAMVEVDGTVVVDASGHFTDPDGDALEYAASSSAPDVATASVAGSEVTLTGVAAGTAEVTVTARDPGGLTASQSLSVTVTPIRKWGPANTYGFYTFPKSLYPMSRFEWTMLPIQAPAESLHEKELLHYWAMQFLHDDQGRLAGYAGLQSQGRFKGESLNRRVVNFAIWDSDASNTDNGMVNAENTECRCHQIMLPFQWEEGTPYRFVVDTGPSGETDEYRWWGLWVTNTATDSTTFVGETRSWRRRIEDPPVSWAEDLHWWQTWVGNAAYECEDFESSSLAVLDVLADGVSPIAVHALTSGGKEVTGPNGHRTTLCDTAVTYSRGTDVQHNLGYWSTAPENVLEKGSPP